MVNRLERKGSLVYQCEFCGFGYEFLETAEMCEEYCNTHGGCSPDITERAVYKPTVRVIAAAS